MAMAAAAVVSVHADTWMWGVADCAQWLNPPFALYNQYWLNGYMFGHASGDVYRPNVLRESTSEQAVLWMNNYCKANPLSDANEGGNALYQELVKRQASHHK